MGTNMYISNICQNYDYLKFSKVVVGTSNVVGPRNRCGVYVWVCEGKWVYPEGGEEKNIFLSVSTPIYVSNQLHRPFILKNMKVCAMRTWLL